MSKEKNTFSIYFPGRLKSLMNSRVPSRWTQAELAEKLGVTQATVQRWVTGNAVPGSVELLKIAGVFGVTMESLLTENPVTKRKARP